MKHGRSAAKHVLFAVTACHALTVLVVSSPDCHQQCTLIRSSLDPHRACKSSRRNSDQTLGRACEFGFNNGYLRVCMAMCREGESEELLSPVETCARYDANGATRKPRLACEAGYQNSYIQIKELVGRAEIPTNTLQEEDTEVVSYIENNAALNRTEENVLENTEAAASTQEQEDPKHTLQLTVPFEEESIYDLPEHVRAIRSLPSVDVQENSLQDATHKFCRENAHFGPACHRQVLMATLQEGIRAKAKEGGKDVERLLKKHGPDIRRWPFTFESNA